MKILAVGDIVGAATVDYFKSNLWKTRDSLGVDFVVANGENASDIHGIGAADAQTVLDSGVDLITLGNHTWSRKDIYDFLDSNPTQIIRPANYPSSCPGFGYAIRSIQGYRVLFMNANGQAFMDPLDSPFDAIELILAREEGNFDISVLDFHAEATSEKYAIARYFDGKINIIFGTHTHVPTADLQILPGGTAYVTDLGMSGPVNGILGTDSAASIRRIKDHMPARFVPATGEIRASAVLFELDGVKVVRARRVTF